MTGIHVTELFGTDGYYADKALELLRIRCLPEIEPPEYADLMLTILQKEDIYDMLKGAIGLLKTLILHAYKCKGLSPAETDLHNDALNTMHQAERLEILHLATNIAKREGFDTTSTENTISLLEATLIDDGGRTFHDRLHHLEAPDCELFTTIHLCELTLSADCLTLSEFETFLRSLY